ncbi:MAG TPA: hypothetical protein VL200_05295 [Lacunisphaera sp.]|jgi:hypothetical protein|nr:hypothetical protein [Lacunisphaera sp.]
MTRPDQLRLGPRLRAWTYATLGALFVTGVAWWSLELWGRVETEFGPAAHPAGPWLLRFHGAAAMIFLVLIGWLLPSHVRRGWQARRNRRSGGGLLASLGALTLTGWLLYYAGSEPLRAVATTVHRWLGLILPLLVVLHVWIGRRSRPVERRRDGPMNPRSRPTNSGSSSHEMS